jgi:hypothetical protein
MPPERERIGFVWQKTPLLAAGMCWEWRFPKHPIFVRNRAIGMQDIHLQLFEHSALFRSTII